MKVTSILLATLILTGSLTFAIPGTPAEAVTANLIVSAENDITNNKFGGPQVVEIVVDDPDRSNTNEGEGEPDVTVNGENLRMVQATDGLWYAYIANLDAAVLADRINGGLAGDDLNPNNPPDNDQSNPSPRLGLDFGYECRDASILGVAFNADAVFLPRAPTGNDCNARDVTGDPLNNVVKRAKDVNIDQGGGQIGLPTKEMWPFIQLYEFSSGGDVNIVYNKGGNPQQITLGYEDDLDDYASLIPDRVNVPHGAQLHLTLSDFQINIDPTDHDVWTFGTNSSDPSVYYGLFDDSGTPQYTNSLYHVNWNPHLSDLDFGDNGVLVINADPDRVGIPNLLLQTNTEQKLVNAASDNSTIASTPLEPQDAGISNFEALSKNSQPVTFVESAVNSGIFKNTDEAEYANIVINALASRGTTATLDYADSPQSVRIENSFAYLAMTGVDGVWNSGEELSVLLIDEDINLNTLKDEDLSLESEIIPTIVIGNPITLADGHTMYNATGSMMSNPVMVDDTNMIGVWNVNRTAENPQLAIAADTLIYFDLSVTVNELSRYLESDSMEQEGKFHFINYDVSDVNAGNPTFMIGNQTIITTSTKGLVHIPDDIPPTQGIWPAKIGIQFPNDVTTGNEYHIVLDIFRFGISGTGELANERFNDAIYRHLLEESADNTGAFMGTIEYIMLNQLNVRDHRTYERVTAISDELVIIIGEDHTDEDSVRVTYADLGEDGQVTPVSDQQEAPSHTGIVSLDSESYKIADTVTVTLDDPDLNTDVDTIQTYRVVPPTNDTADDMVGAAGHGKATDGTILGRLLDITFNDQTWLNSRSNANEPDIGMCSGTVRTGGGLASTGFTLSETTKDSGIFKGSFQIPVTYCDRDGNRATLESVTGVDIEVNYVDFRDQSGERNEFGDSAGVRANTGSVTLDRSVYPVPFGTIANFEGSNEDRPSIFRIHDASIRGDVDNDETLGNGDLTIHVRVNDPDYDISSSGEDRIAIVPGSDDAPFTDSDGPLTVSVSRGSQQVILGTAGSASPHGTQITVGNDVTADTRDFGPLVEVSPDSGIFEVDIPISYNHGPAGPDCPNSNGDSMAIFSELDDDGYCILQGDILTVEYNDPTDASGNQNTVTDSATFDLRNGVLQADKPVYIIGSDMILTLIEPDLDLDNDQAETWSLDLIEWNSDAADITMGPQGGQAAAFDPEPSNFRETGDSTGIFQVVVEIPAELGNDSLERGEEIILEYTDWGPSGADYVGDQDEDVHITIYTSNFGATIELDQQVYTWTDKVYITVVAPDHNFDSNLIDEIGDGDDTLEIRTQEGELDNYRLVETGSDTGIFTGEVILTGFPFNADGNLSTGEAVTGHDVTHREDGGDGPTDGFLSSSDNSGISVSYEFTENETVLDSALIRWNIADIQWLEASYPATGTGIVRVIDPDMNLNPEAVDNFEIVVLSNSDNSGIRLTVTETNDATGIFEGTVFFTVTDSSSGHRLHVQEGDTVTAKYDDNTLPAPYNVSDEYIVTATSLIGTKVPPLERAPATNLRITDSQGNSLDSVTVDQQVQITADLTNGQDKDQPVAYLVQIQDIEGVTVKLDWQITTLTPSQSTSQSTSWIPSTGGEYTVTIFVWESINTPTALSPQLVTTLTVN